MGVGVGQWGLLIFSSNHTTSVLSSGSNSELGVLLLCSALFLPRVNPVCAFCSTRTIWCRILSVVRCFSSTLCHHRTGSNPLSEFSGRAGGRLLFVNPFLVVTHGRREKQRTKYSKRHMEFNILNRFGFLHARENAHCVRWLDRVRGAIGATECRMPGTMHKSIVPTTTTAPIFKSLLLVEYC